MVRLSEVTEVVVWEPKPALWARALAVGCALTMGMCSGYLSRTLWHSDPPLPQDGWITVWQGGVMYQEAPRPNPDRWGWDTDAVTEYEFSAITRL